MEKSKVLKINPKFETDYYEIQQKTEHEILLLVAEMRKMQKSYFRYKNRAYLMQCKRLECEVDKLLLKYIGISTDQTKQGKQYDLF